MSESLILNKFEQQAALEKLEDIKRMCRDQVGHEKILKCLDGLESLCLRPRNPEQTYLSAQISLYPLRQLVLSKVINDALEKFDPFELSIIPGSMSTIVSGKANLLWAGLQQAFSAAADQGDLVMILTLSNACPKPDFVESSL
jgi:uncharacterized protein YqgV (UPF0045/DUF77 family)